MADENTDVTDDQLCWIEASVVTGFEECARGEAKEKFNTDVKAARGKIRWKIPIDRVKDVVKMGSIDNCRVVMKSVPHFGFTDQHDSLARLQKMVADLDWDTGLRVWTQFSEFPHPVSPVPESVPSPDELVEVIVFERKALPQPSEDKKGKKGGRGKKKEKKWKERKEHKERQMKNKQNEGEDKKETDCATDNLPVSEATDNLPVSEATDELVKKIHETSFDENGRKTVIVKPFDPNEPRPEIEIKVLIPGPNESAFPTDVDDKDQRDVQPMDVDRSLIQNPDESFTSPALKNSPTKIHSEITNIDDLKDDTTGPTKESTSTETKSPASPFKQPSSAINILSSAKDFASSVIEKLTSPLPSQHAPDNNSSTTSPSCVTPPPTPVQPGLDFFMKSRLENVKSTPVDDKSVLVQKNTDECKASESEFGSENLNDPLSDTYSSSVDKVEKPINNNEEELSGSSSNTATESSQIVTENDSEESKVDPDQPPIGESLKDVPDDTTVPPPVKKERDPTKPTFRVTCNRVGDSHSFDSTSAAASFGSAIVRYHNWSVDLKNSDIEVLLNIENEEVTVALAITKSSLHRRNLVAFGPTSLRATICYNMLRLCRIRNGDFVCDPMCGTSAIPIEGSLNWPHSFFISGDYHEKAMERSIENVAAIQKGQQEEKKGTLKMDTVQWNIEHFPLRDKCVDVFVSDLPFGHRMGSRTTNRTLYPSLLSTMARTARYGARACLLTEDKTSLIKALQTLSQYWQRRLVLSINIGGLWGFVFLLVRTTASYSHPTTLPQSWRKDEAPSSTDSPKAGDDAVKQEGSGDCVENATAAAAAVTDSTPLAAAEQVTGEEVGANKDSSPN